MQEHLYSSRTLLYRRFLCHVVEAQSLHRLEEDRSFVPARVGEDRFAAGREQVRYEAGEGGGIFALVKDVCGEDQVEGPHTPYVRLAPVENGDLRFQAQVRAGVVGGEVEGRFVVVRSEDFGAAGESEDGGKADATSELDGAGTGEVAFGEVTRQGEGARPEFGPVGEPFVAVEVFLVDQFVRRDGLGNAVCLATDLYRGVGQVRKAAKMGTESIQGSSAGCGGGLVG